MQTLHKHLIKHLRKWHRKLGIIAAIFLVFLSISGIALNHTDDLALAHQPIENNWLLNHYGISAPKDLRFYQQNELIVTNNMVWLNEKKLLDSAEKIIAVSRFANIIVVVSSNQIFLYTEQGDVIDTLDSLMGVPKNITAIEQTKDHLLVKTPVGLYQIDENFLEWNTVFMVKEPQWLSSNSASTEEVDQAKMQYRAQFLTWERIILDAHSGRIFGFFGVLLMDVVAILLILLSLSGIYIWLRYAKSKR